MYLTYHCKKWQLCHPLLTPFSAFEMEDTKPLSGALFYLKIIDNIYKQKLRSKL